MEEERYNDIEEKLAIHQMANQGNSIMNQNRMVQYQMEEQERTLAEAQLDCNETLTELNHLLKQDILKVNNEGVLEWSSITDAKKRVLTDEGVDKIMQICRSYINKETLLSNFDENMINRRMLEFSLALSALLFLKYEIYFTSPTSEECKDILNFRIEDKIKKKKLSCDITQEAFDYQATRKAIISEIVIEHELEKIREEQVKLNLREFEMIFIQIKSLVESTHNRAWKGEERGSLRRHFNISEVIGGGSQMMQQKKKLGFFGM